ncbi:MAG TPA: hypothetical protein PLM79_00970 [Syntrophobacteraceae bacterium]|nr:hypothetical protein [Syntrophobacteraceae bacterium]
MPIQNEAERILTEEACRWVSSPDGQRKLLEAIARSQKLIDSITAAQEVDHKVLAEPIQ